MTSGGVELYAVCERQVVKAGEEKRNQKANELRQEQFERLARKHLKDLMDVAVIENR
jgi:peptidyl-prolyl cis-trans isomerase SurA